MANVRRRERLRRAKNLEPRTSANPGCQEIVRPPLEVLAERDYRRDLLWGATVDAQLTGSPPVGYCSHYWLSAQRNQRMFAEAT